jgi:hypothetical protein
MQIPSEVMPRLVAKAKEMLEGYDGGGIDTWDAVMVNDTDGYDINVYQWDSSEPLSVVAYEVIQLSVNSYSNYQDITQEVMK